MLTSLRAARLSDRRFIDTVSVAEADALIPELLEFAARPRSGGDVEELLRVRLGDRKPRVWWALRTFAPLLEIPSGGPWLFGSGSSFVGSNRAGPEA